MASVVNHRPASSQLVSDGAFMLWVPQAEDRDTLAGEQSPGGGGLP